MSGITYNGIDIKNILTDNNAIYNSTNKNVIIGANSNYYKSNNSTIYGDTNNLLDTSNNYLCANSTYYNINNSNIDLNKTCYGRYADFAYNTIGGSNTINLSNYLQPDPNDTSSIPKSIRVFMIGGGGGAGGNGGNAHVSVSGSNNSNKYGGVGGAGGQGEIKFTIIDSNDYINNISNIQLVLGDPGNNGNNGKDDSANANSDGITKNGSATGTSGANGGNGNDSYITFTNQTIKSSGGTGGEGGGYAHASWNAPSGHGGYDGARGEHSNTNLWFNTSNYNTTQTNYYIDEMITTNFVNYNNFTIKDNFMFHNETNNSIIENSGKGAYYLSNGDITTNIASNNSNNDNLTAKGGFCRIVFLYE